MATEAWRWQGGTDLVDELSAAAFGPDGSVVLVGSTYGEWHREHSSVADWAAVELDTEGDILWKWQNGTYAFEYVGGVAVGNDGSIVLGCHGAPDLRPPDFTALKFDADRNAVWEWQENTRTEDVVEAVAIADDNSIILAGYTRGNWSTINSGGTDFAAAKISADGDLLWQWQNGTSGDDYIRAAAVGDDDSIVLAGYSNGDWSGVGSGLYDFVAVKLDGDGSELWRWQDGTSSPDRLWAAVIGEDGSIVLAGYTDGDWGESGAAGERDFAAIKLDSEGSEMWRWQDGTAGADGIYAAAMADDGSIFLAGYTEGDWEGVNAGDADFAAVNLHTRGSELWRYQSGTNGTDYILGATTNSLGRLAFAGQTSGSWEEVNLGESDFAVLMLDVVPFQTPSPVSMVPPLATSDSGSSTGTGANPLIIGLASATAASVLIAAALFVNIKRSVT